MGKKRGLFLSLTAAAMTGVGFLAGNRLYGRFIKPQARPEDEPDHSTAVTEGRRFVREHAGHQDVYLDSIDLVKLHAVYIEAQAASSRAGSGDGQNHRYAILVHGINDHCESMGIYARHYLMEGIHVLLPDLRGFGKSEGDYVGYGYDDRLDIIEWIYWILHRDPAAQIILHGTSMGAATVLMTAGEHLPANVVAVISDSAYTSAREAFSHVQAQDQKTILPFSVAFTLLRWETRARAGYDLEDVSPVEAVGRARVPILFLHGDADRLVPVSMAMRLYEEAAGKKRLVTFLGADHLRAVVTEPEKYWDEIDRLLKDVRFF